jgi:hypothetical protein
LDQMKERATPAEQQHIHRLHEKFMRTLHLKLQFD